MAPPFRKAEFVIYYDGRKMDKADELAEVALLKGLIPKYDAAGNLSATGRNYKWASEPAFLAKKKDDVVVELRKFPKVQEELLEIIKNGIDGDSDVDVFESQDTDAELSDEDFERIALEDAEKIKNGRMSDAEEEESSWDDI